MATLKCEAAGQLLEILQQLEQLYFQSRQFGFYFLQLTTRRLFGNIVRPVHPLEMKAQQACPLVAYPAQTAAHGHRPGLLRRIVTGAGLV